MKKIRWTFWRKSNFDAENQENFYETLKPIIKEDLTPLGNYIYKSFRDNRRLVSNIVIWPKTDKELTINELKSELMQDKHLRLFLIVEKGNFIYHPQIRNTKKFPIAQYQGDQLAITNRQNVVFGVNISLLKDKYLWLLFKSEFIESQIFFLAGDGLQGGISWEGLKGLPIKVPELDVQQKFIDIYEFLSYAIHIRKEINKELENIMLSRFKEIQYDGTKSTRKLKAIYSIIVGWLLPEDINSQDLIIRLPVLNREQLMSRDRKFIFNIKESKIPSNIKNYKLPKVPKNSIIIVKMLLMNNTSLAQKIISNVSIIGQEVNLNQELCGLYPKREIGLYYGYFLIKSNIASLSKKANVTRTRYHLTKQAIENFEVSVAGQEKINKFNKWCEDLFQLQNCNEEIIKELQSLQQYSIEYIATSN